MKVINPLYFILFFVWHLGIVAQIVPPMKNPVIQDPIHHENSDQYTLVNDIKKIKFIDDKATVSFDFMSENTKGTLGGISLDINYEPSDLGSSSFSGTATIATLKTGNFLRDGHLMWKKYFNAKNFPILSFSSNLVTSFDSETFIVEGKLTIKGIAKKVMIKFVDKTQTLKGTVTIYTSDFDINIKDNREENKLLVTFNFPYKIE